MSFVGSLALNLGWLLIFTTVLRLAEWLQGWREIRFTVCAWLGLFAFIGIHAILEAYRLVSGIESQIFVWQLSLIATAWMFAALWKVISGRPLYHRPLFWATVLVSCLLPFISMEAIITQKFAEFVLTVFIFALGLECFLALKGDDEMAKTIWQVLLLSLLITSLQVLDCQLLNNPYAPREEGSACEQLYGWTRSWVPTFIPLGGMAIIIWRHRNQG